MRIAVAVLENRTIATHGGRARRFMVFDAQPGAEPVEAGSIHLSPEEVLHHAGDGRAHLIDAVQVVIAGSSGQGFRDHMARRGITAVLTSEPDPVQAVRDYLAGAVKPAAELAHPHHNPHDREP